MPSDDAKIDRRRFFREGLRELLKPLAKAAEPVERALRELQSLDAKSNAPDTAPPPVSLRILRPPGALDEQQFRETCSRCGVCVSVCPANAIKIDTSGTIGGGAPYILASEMACVVCDGLHCMQNCPSGALQLVPMTEIDIGTAVWHEHRCLRSQGQECRICLDQCPLGTAAITMENGKIKVIEEGCTGCGVCEHECPTSPKAITVTPKAQRDSGAVARST